MSGGEDADRGVNVVDVDDELAHPLLRRLQRAGHLRALADQPGQDVFVFHGARLSERPGYTMTPWWRVLPYTGPMLSARARSR